MAIVYCPRCGDDNKVQHYYACWGESPPEKPALCRECQQADRMAEALVRALRKAAADGTLTLSDS